MAPAIPFAPGLYSVPIQRHLLGLGGSVHLAPPSFLDRDGREVEGIWVEVACGDGYKRYRALPTLRRCQHPANAARYNGGRPLPEERAL